MGKSLSPEVRGRLRVVESLVDLNEFSLNSGSKEVRFEGNKWINIDANPRCRPDVVADARCLPFRKGVFSQVVFSDVMEHLPRNDEHKALEEIHRCLRRYGKLILTTPNHRLLFTSLDPARYVVGHRHYRVSDVRNLVSRCGFRPERVFTRGFVWALATVLWYCLVTYPAKKLLDYPLQAAPLPLHSLENREYVRNNRNGYTIFLEAVRV